MKFLRALVAIASFAYVAMFAYVAVMRLRAPSELTPLPPFMGTPSALAQQAVAIVATIVTAACIWRMSRTHGGSGFWAWASVGIFFAGFALTGFTYDLDAGTSLCTALIAMAAVVTSEARGAIGAVLGGLLLGAACLLRSPAALLVVFAFFTLIKTPGRAFGLLLAAAAVVAPIALWQRHAFWAYALKLPYSFADLRTLGHDLPRAFTILIATMGVVPTLWRKPSLFAALMFASFVAALASHTLLFWIPFGCIALALLASRIEVLLVGNLLAARAGELLCAVVLAQLALLAYNPRALRPIAAPTAASTPAPQHRPRRNTARSARGTHRACTARRAAAR